MRNEACLLCEGAVAVLQPAGLDFQAGIWSQSAAAYSISLVYLLPFKAQVKIQETLPFQTCSSALPLFCKLYPLSLVSQRIPPAFLMDGTVKLKHALPNELLSKD